VGTALPNRGCSAGAPVGAYLGLRILRFYLDCVISLHYTPYCTTFGFLSPPTDPPSPRVGAARTQAGISPTPSFPLPLAAPPPTMESRRKQSKGTPAPPSRKRRKPTGAAPPSLAPAPSVRTGPGNGGAHAPTERRRRKRTGTAAPPCPAPRASVRMGPGDEGTPPQRKRKGSSSTRQGKRGRPTDSERRSSIRTSSAGCPESSAGEDDTCEDLAGHGDDPNASGAGGARHPHGSPDALAAPSKDVATGGKIVVAHTPNTPPRYSLRPRIGVLLGIRRLLSSPSSFMSLHSIN
jgi:hypothetical protein